MQRPWVIPEEQMETDDEDSLDDADDDSQTQERWEIISDFVTVWWTIGKKGLGCLFVTVSLKGIYSCNVWSQGRRAKN